MTGSFKAWNEFSLRQNPFSGYFPAMLTAKAGVDNDLVDMMVSLFDSGMKSEQFANMLKELHTSHKTKLEILREGKIQQGTLKKKGELFSTFNDPSKYNGRLHGGSFFSFVLQTLQRKVQSFSRQGNEEAGRNAIKLGRVIQDLQGVESYRRELAVQSLDHGDERIWRDSDSVHDGVGRARPNGCAVEGIQANAEFVRPPPPNTF